MNTSLGGVSSGSNSLALLSAKIGSLSRLTKRDRLDLRAAGRRNQEFLPAHLEILVKPPSPLATAFLWTLCAMIVAGLTWSGIARLDIFAEATGRVQPDGRSKVVQPLETGRVRAILTRNGAVVRAGDVVIDLDATRDEAEALGAQSDLNAVDAQIERRKTVIQAITNARSAADPVVPPDLATSNQPQEQAAMRADLLRVSKARASLMAQIDEKTATEARINASIAARTRLVAALRERQSMRQALMQKDAGTKAALIDATQQLEQASADLAYDTGQLTETLAAQRSLRSKIEELEGQMLSDETQHLADVVEKRSAALERLTQAQFKLVQSRLTAPIDGTVQQLGVTSVGQVVAAGQPLLVIVPSGSVVEVSAMVPSRDIGFVKAGQSAVVKVDAFPFAQYGSLEGRVEVVSRDAVDVPEAGGSSDTIRASKGGGINEVTGVPSTQNLMFPVMIRLDKAEIQADGGKIPVTAGMTATVEIRTGSRRVIDYLISPLIETFSSSGHER